MVAHRRRFTAEEKMEILEQARQLGIAAALRKHNLSYSVFHRWKEKLDVLADGDEKRGQQKNVQEKLRELMNENALLKKIISNQAMLIELKDAALKSHAK